MVRFLQFQDDAIHVYNDNRQARFICTSRRTHELGVSHVTHIEANTLSGNLA